MGRGIFLGCFLLGILAACTKSSVDPKKMYSQKDLVQKARKLGGERFVSGKAKSSDAQPIFIELMKELNPEQQDYLFSDRAVLVDFINKLSGKEYADRAYIKKLLKRYDPWDNAHPVKDGWEYKNLGEALVYKLNTTQLTVLAELGFDPTKASGEIILQKHGKVERGEGSIGSAAFKKIFESVYETSGIGEKERTKDQHTISKNRNLKCKVTKAGKKIDFDNCVHVFTQGDYSYLAFTANVAKKLALTRKERIQVEIYGRGCFWAMSSAPFKKVYCPQGVADPFAGGLARHQGPTGKLGFINEKLDTVVQPAYDFVLPFTNGVSKACVGCQRRLASKGQPGGIWFKIDKRGNIVGRCPAATDAKSCK